MKMIEKIKQEVKKELEGINPCHDIMHTERVLDLALSIGKKEKCDFEILELAALLHDIARKKQDESNGEICHAKEGAKMARKILERYDYDEDKIDRIVHCIETHRFRNNKIPESKEAKALYDADKLDSIGAIGIGRAFSFSGSIGSYVHNPNIDIDKTRWYTKEDCAYREFLVILSKIKDKMLTNEGKRIAEERHKYMVDFFDRLNKEVKGLK